jgi:alcohol dehydrogenase class IV
LTKRGGLLDAPHGALCAVLVPGVVRANVRAIAARVPDHPARRRFETVAQLLTGRPSATAEDGAAWLQKLVTMCRIPQLAAHGFTPAQIPGIVERAQRANSMKGNPIELTADELADVLQAAM